MLSKADGLIDWSKNAQQIKNFVRGMNPWPCAFTNLNGVTYKIHKVSVCESKYFGRCGEIVECNKNSLIVACGSGFVSIDIIQAPNARKMNIKDYLMLL